jgi:hypothetical protein
MRHQAAFREPAQTVYRARAERHRQDPPANRED